MRRKLGVIAAMLPEPELLVLDEPTTGVDPVSRANLWWLIARAAAGGAAILMSTTYLDEAARVAHVLVLDAGQTLAEAPRPRSSRPSRGPSRSWPAVPTAWMAAPGLAAGGRLAGMAVRRPGAQAPPPELVTPDLQDAVCIAELRAELDRADA